MVRFSKPIAYQLNEDGTKKEIMVSYKIVEGGYSFKVGNYDKSKTLYIDPFIYSTYFSSNDADRVMGIIHYQGNEIIVTGQTKGAPILNTSATLNGYDAYIAKVDIGTGTITQIAYFGGTGDEKPVNPVLYTDNSVNPAVTYLYTAVGTPNANTSSYSCTNSKFNNNGGSGDIILLRFNPSDLSQAPVTYCLGDNGGETPWRITVDTSDGDVFLLATCYSFSGSGQECSISVDPDPSDNNIEPFMPNGTSNSSAQIYVAKFDKTLQNFLAATYYGDAQPTIGPGCTEIPGDIMIHPSNGNVYIITNKQACSYPSTVTSSSSVLRQCDNSGSHPILLVLNNNLSNQGGDPTYPGLQAAGCLSYSHKYSRLGFSFYPYQSNNPTDVIVGLITPSLGNTWMVSLLAIDVQVTTVRATYDIFTNEYSATSRYQDISLYGKDHYGAFRIRVDSSDKIWFVWYDLLDPTPAPSDHAFGSPGTNNVIIQRFSYTPPSGSNQGNFSPERTAVIGGTNAIQNAPSDATVVEDLYLLPSANAPIVAVVGYTYVSDLPVSQGSNQSTDCTKPINTFYPCEGFVAIFDYELIDNSSSPLINSLSVNPTFGQSGTTVTLSWDITHTDNDTITCEIYWEGTSSQPQTVNPCSNTGSLDHTYNTGGTKNILFKVIDSYFPSANIQSTAQVIINSTPTVGNFSVNPSLGDAPLTVTFSWQINDPDGDTLTCKIDIDNDGKFDYTITACTNSKTQKHTYDKPNTYTVKLRIDDGKGGSAEQILIVTVKAVKDGGGGNDNSGNGSGGNNNSGNGSGGNAQSGGKKGCSGTPVSANILFLITLTTILLRKLFKKE